ncbi:MAG: metallophosphoesterase [Flavobacteriaceae bacterium]|nr:metallophosphoesterase [Flavobacteriaceae bacterium]
MSRKIVIGDIHGGLRALTQLLERAEVVPSDTLIFLGDYVDGWSEAAQTISFLIELSKRNTCIYILGNHDQLCRDWLSTGHVLSLWTQQGGAETMASYENVSSEEKQAHLGFFEGLKEYYIDPENRLFIHAGFTNMHGVNQEYFRKMFYWDRTLWEMALSLDPQISREADNYPKRLQLYKEIYIGHTPVTQIGKTVPVQAANVWNIDTGAAFKGPLTAMDIDKGDIWQSDPVHSLYPGENGRNKKPA